MVQSTKVLCHTLAMCSVVAAEQHEDSVSLLQLSAAKKHSDSETTQGWPEPSLLPCHYTHRGRSGKEARATVKIGALADIDSTMKDRDLKICRGWGDVHVSTSFLDKSMKYDSGSRWVFAQWATSRVAAACDGSWEIQQFQLPCGALGCQNGAAIKVGSMKFEVYNPSGVANDVKCYIGMDGKTPCPASGSHGGVTWSFANNQAFCLEYANQFAITIHKFDWGHQWDQIIHVPKSVCTTKSGNMCGGEEHLVDGKSCNDQDSNCQKSPGQDYYTLMEGNEVTSEQQLFSETALNILCKRHGKHSNVQMKLEDCTFPDKTPGSNQEICEQNGNKLSDVEAICKPLQEKYPGFYYDCLTDECANENPQEEKDIEMIAEETTEENTCLKDPCNDEDICDAIALSLDEVHSNLGGKGPDTGAEEMRFSSVATINGVATDLVIVSNSKYKPKKPENNVASNGIGVINLDGGQKVSLTFTLVKTATNEEISLDVPFKMAFVDVDKGKNGNTETITVCGAENIYLRKVSLLKSSEGEEDCYVISAGAPGTGADNPTSLDLTEAQKTRSFDITIKSGSFTMELEVKDKKGRMSARNFMFGGQSVTGHCDD